MAGQTSCSQSSLPIRSGEEADSARQPWGTATVFEGLGGAEVGTLDFVVSV